MKATITPLPQARELLDELAWLEQIETESELRGEPMPELLNLRMLQLDHRRADLQRQAALDALADAVTTMTAALAPLINSMNDFALALRPLLRNIDRRRINKAVALAAHRERKAGRAPAWKAAGR